MLSALLCQRDGIERGLAAPSLLPKTDLVGWFKSSTDVHLTMVHYTINYYPIKRLPAGFFLWFIWTQTLFTVDECTTLTNLT